MKYLDRVLEILQDFKWHTIESIKSDILLPNEKLNIIFHFLKEQGFIDNEDEKIRITSLGLRFLKL